MSEDMGPNHISVIKGKMEVFDYKTERRVVRVFCMGKP